MIPPAHSLLWVLLLTSFLGEVAAQQETQCSVLTNCKSGCCSKYGSCGFGPDFCGQGCQGTCNATAECGKYATQGHFDCPLKVCCSEYGYCGTTSEFCNHKCQNEGGCLPVLRPQCSSNSDAMSSKARIAYYGVWGATRTCNSIQPEAIPAGVLTHINVAFEYVSEGFEMTDTSGSVVARIARLKRSYPGLRVNIAIGGWAFNDPPTRYRFSDMASSVPNRQKFIASLVRYVHKYGLDGVDIDWEYPVADDRGGAPADLSNFVLLCKDIKKAFDATDPGWQLTVTLPSSYWYLRGFDVRALEKHVDWFNVMTYDIHGAWDQKNAWTGPYLKGHSNITEMEEGLDLLWRNSIAADKVVMGYGFYGRGFVMENPSCNKPPACTFSGPSFGGDCTNEPGILSYAEVMGHKSDFGSETFYDEASSVKWMIYGSNQWISYDDAQSFKRKLQYQSSRCLKGLMIWALDLDTPDFDAMTDLFGEAAMANALGDTSLNTEEKKQLVDELSAYTGQDCYVTVGCTAGARETNELALCAPGYQSVELAHAPWQIDQQRGLQTCAKNSYHHVCCPTNHAPKSCEWVGAPEREVMGCDRGCGPSQFELTTDSYVDFRGSGTCGYGQRSLCCDSTDVLKSCHWGDCGSGCTSNEEAVAWRLDKDNGALCLKHDSAPILRPYCCSKDDKLQSCAWSNDVTKVPNAPQTGWWADMYTCSNKRCPADKLAVTKALIPHTSVDWLSLNAVNCANWPNSPGMSPEYPLCCDPPYKFSRDKWPVQPKYLWSSPPPDETADVSWEWADNFGNNNHDISPDDLSEHPGADPYGFIMLDGPPGSINNAFKDDFTVVTRQEPLNVRPRSLVTSNRTILENVLEHAEETFRVYCNHPADSVQCRRTFSGGAENTIIRLPHHVGEGPWARIVSMEPESDPNPRLPPWVSRKRSLSDNRNGIYVVKIDYNFHLIKRDEGPVNMRVDYTNIQDYWKDMTDEPASRKKRSKLEPVPQMTFDEWKTRLDRANAAGRTLNPRNGAEKRKSVVMFSPESRPIGPRWFGPFGPWLEKLNKIKASDDGYLPMGLDKLFTLYSGRLSCVNDAGVTIRAGLDITADFSMDMRARYSYYFSGTIIPPKVIDTYAYVGAHPVVTAGLTITGDASLVYPTPRKKMIDTLTYPGLAIKGIAAVGPSLDLYGQLISEVSISGTMRVGATYTFPPIEMYLPNDYDASRNKASKEMESISRDQEGLQPDFRANVEAKVAFSLLVTPEINMGIKVGGGVGKFKSTIVDAHVSTFVNTTIRFYATVKAGIEAGIGGSWSYTYGIKFLYRVGFAVTAELLLYGTWKTKEPWYPWAEQDIDLYGPVNVSSTTDVSRRAFTLPSPLLLSPDPLPSPLFDVPDGMALLVDSPMMSFGIPPILSSGNETSSVGHLVRRQSGNSEFKFGDFKCNTGKGSRCSPESLPVEKRDENKVVDLGPAGAPRSRLQKRAPTDCRKVVPKLYYNCLAYFADYTFTADTNNGGTGDPVSNIPGICTSISTFLNSWQNIGRRGRPGTSTSWLLTWDSTRQEPRRKRSCPGGYCRQDNILKKSIAWGPNFGSDKPELTNCDEFPFASAEEGGDGFYGLSPDDPFGTTRTCVPTWQNDMQGRCNSLLNGLQTNVNYFNDRNSPTEDDPQWKKWGKWPGDKKLDSGWTTKGGWDGRQRLCLYPTTQPPAFGLTAADRKSPKLSYYHKRNFTIEIVKPSNGAITFPDSSGVSGTLRAPTRQNRPRPVNDQLTNVNNVICAVNTMGQQRYRVSESYNGWCWDGTTMTSEWKGQITQIRYFACTVDFTPPAADTNTDTRKKRDIKSNIIGYLGDDPIYEIKRVEGEDRIITVKVPVRGHHPGTNAAGEMNNTAGG